MDPRNDCPEPVPILYGSADAKYLITGTIAMYSCLEGYVLKGSSIVHCNLNTNHWPTEDIPSCSKSINTKVLNIEINISMFLFFKSSIHISLTASIKIQIRAKN